MVKAREQKHIKAVTYVCETKWCSAKVFGSSIWTVRWVWMKAMTFICGSKSCSAGIFLLQRCELESRIGFILSKIGFKAVTFWVCETRWSSTTILGSIMEAGEQKCTKAVNFVSETKWCFKKIFFGWMGKAGEQERKGSTAMLPWGLNLTKEI